ncbi:NAD(P)-binding protein, partial [Ophiobolus disseminans]
IATRLRDDEALINAGQPCSWVAWYLKDYDTPKGKAVAEHLAPIPGLSHDIKRLIYGNILRKVRKYLDNGGTSAHMEIAPEPLAPSELVTALKVIAHLQEIAVIHKDTPAEAITSWLEQQLTPQETAHKVSETHASSNIPRLPPTARKRLCYICRITITNPYPAQPSMCIPCGAFNSSSSLLSTPPKLTLPSSFTALVTGARINLGYHTVLRLLRCGARVIATTRYPRDAVVRYLDESDSADWKDRLRIVGADFRSASDAFSLVRETKSCLQAWASGDDAKLCLLINNAAQTLTDSVKKEERAVHLEQQLRDETESEVLLIEGTYTSRVRGGALPLAIEAPNGSLFSHGSLASVEEAAETVQELVSASYTTDLEPYSKSSWVQSLFEIPYEDVMSAHAVNTFVPLILCRELLPLMGCTDSTSPSSIKPQGYIINVSSREGIFEDRTKSTAKRGKHVHTNMSKAALNMITETEAAAAWQTRRVAMNTVDPGYMSAAPEYEDAFDGIRPIGWEDGAGRVLWPIALSEVEGEVIWGRFLKHYGAVQVDPGVGRG